jgi:L-lactate dehydrogenase complex protein LldG
VSASEEARRTILGSIRRSLVASAPHDVVHAERHQPPVPSHGIPLPVLTANGGAAAPRPDAATADPLALFQVRLEAVGGTFTVARGAAEVATSIERILTQSGAQRAAASDSPRVRPLVEAACAAAGVELRLDAPHAELFDCDVGISGAQWGIAETGTLVLESARERHRFVSLIPRVHVALLRADRICTTLGEALRHVREGDPEETVQNAAITFVTGPSRTSDIELTLAIGVHGPQELHVILMEPAESPSESPMTAGVQPSDRG